MRKGEFEILQAVLTGPLSFTELRKATGRSAPSLSENLKRLMERGLVIKTADEKYGAPDPWGTHNGGLYVGLRRMFLVLQLALNVDGHSKHEPDMRPVIARFALNSVFAGVERALSEAVEKGDVGLFTGAVSDYITPFLVALYPALQEDEGLRDEVLKAGAGVREARAEYEAELQTLIEETLERLKASGIPVCQVPA